jgi:hypothetical protein
VLRENLRVPFLAKWVADEPCLEHYEDPPTERER